MSEGQQSPSGPEIERLREENRGLRERLAELEALVDVVGRVERDLQFAHSLQNSFLPRTPPEIPGMRLAAVYQPAQEVGGDFYDFVPLREGRFGMLIGDVAGKGVPAALFMAWFSSRFRSLALQGLSAAETMALADTAVGERHRAGVFVTCVYVIVDPSSGSLCICNAGHPVPLVRTPSGALRGIGENIDVPLGILPGTRYAEASVQLARGETMALMTDGVFEARRAGGEMYGIDRLLEVVSRAGDDPGGLAAELAADVARFRGEAGKADDLTVVALRRDG